MAQYSYHIDVYNEYLGKYRRVAGRTKREARYKAEVLQSQWAEQEARARYRQAIADAKAQAVALTEDARAEIAAHRAILEGTLTVDDRVPWDELLAPRPFGEEPPSLEEIAARLNIPRCRPVLEALRLASRSRREAAEADARALFSDESQGFERRRETYEAATAAELEELRSIRDGYERRDPSAVPKYLRLVLTRSKYPQTFPGVFEIAFVESTRTAVVDLDVPRIEEVPRITQYRFDLEREEFVATTLSEHQLADLYDEVVYQTILRTIHEVFESDYIESVNDAVVNARTIALNPGTGLDEHRCIATCGSSCEAFRQLDLSRVKPVACFRALKGLSGPRPSSLRAVQPLRAIAVSTDAEVEIDLGDRGDVPDDLLAMDPFAFEELIGAMFRRVFANERAVVDVTQCSRDGGVDVVVDDPDPIKGGKTVIQVKRYHGVIGVGYVRELYGTMINEGAAKGILVGTGHYGSDARAFADGKPITLIDGNALLVMLAEHGWRYRIGENAAVPAVG